MAFVSADRELKIEIETLTGLLCIFHRQNVLNSEFVHCMRTAFNQCMPNSIFHRYQLKQSISILREVRWYFFHFYSNFNRKLCKQPVETLIRHRVRL